MAHPRTHRIAGTRGLGAGLATALLAVLVLAGCAYTTGASTSASQRGATPAELAAPVQAARPTPPSPPVRHPSPKPAARPENRCAHNTGGAQLVLVSVTRQHAWMCQGAHVVYAAPVTTGAVDLPYRDTPTGTFQIQGKYTDQTLTLASGAQYQVKYWIPFQGPLYGFHDAPWQTFPFGGRQYRTQGSHGCVHLSVPAMKFLYGWADIGTPVTITA